MSLKRIAVFLVALALVGALVVGGAIYLGLQSSDDCPTTLSLTTVEADSNDRTVAFENLSNPRQTEFVAALENGSVEIDTNGSWVSMPLVVYENETYHADVAVC